MGHGGFERMLPNGKFRVHSYLVAMFLQNIPTRIALDARLSVACACDIPTSRIFRKQIKTSAVEDEGPKKETYAIWPELNPKVFYISILYLTKSTFVCIWFHTHSGNERGPCRLTTSSIIFSFLSGCGERDSFFFMNVLELIRKEMDTSCNFKITRAWGLTLGLQARNEHQLWRIDGSVPFFLPHVTNWCRNCFLVRVGSP